MAHQSGPSARRLLRGLELKLETDVFWRVCATPRCLRTSIVLHRRERDLRLERRWMSRPFTLVQISDPHLGASWAHGEPVDLLAATVDRIRVSGPSPDALLVTGDLADHATDDEYRQVREVLELLAVPIYALPGNHDDRGALRRHFGLPGVDDEPVNYTVDLGELRLVVLDSTRPGEGRWRAQARAARLARGEAC